MPGDNLWVVLHATEVNGTTLQIPKKAAKLIGLRADLPSPGNGVAFLDRGPRVLRVMAMADPTVGVTKESTNALIAVATPTKQPLFNLPTRVRKHLALSRRPVVAWLVPQREWDERANRGHVYVTNSSFPLLKPVESLERAYTSPRPV
ncbi:MAG: hypothetical protein KGI98_17470 [Euryarchaeota archaeon]|nr:hypothetical protein [Euryarchaeota archaeon]